MKYAMCFWITLGCLFLSGCGSLSPREMPEIARYQLTKPAVKQYSTKRKRGVLYVMSTTASPGYQSNQMMYTLQEKPYQLRAFSRHRWVSSPAQMLTSLLRDSLANSRVFDSVVTAPYVGSSDVMLYTQLTQLQQDFYGQRSRVHIALVATLVDGKTHRVIKTQRFSQILGSPAANPRAGVIAMNDALQMLLNQVVKFALI